jgi:hypothetical protein
MKRLVGAIILYFGLGCMVFTLAFGHLPLSYQVGIGLLIPLVALVGVWLAFAPSPKSKP